jgi:hypothetical protein
MLQSGEWVWEWRTCESLERGGVSPEGASSPRARRSLARGCVQASSEAEFRWYGAVPLEQSGVSPEGCRGRPLDGPTRGARAVGSRHQVVIAWDAFYDL